MRKAIVAGVLLAAALVVCAARPQSTNQSGSAAGSNGQVQFNNSGAFGGATGLVASNSATALTVTGNSGGSSLIVSGSAAMGANAIMNLTAGGGSGQLLQINGGSLTYIANNGGWHAVLTETNCSSSASPAVCGSAASGSVALAAAATTEQVNTTAVTANSQVQLTFDSSLGTKLGVTCNTTVVQPTVSARTGGSNFTITVPTAPTTNPACFSYTITN